MTLFYDIYHWRSISIKPTGSSLKKVFSTVATLLRIKTLDFTGVRLASSKSIIEGNIEYLLSKKCFKPVNEG